MAGKSSSKFASISFCFEKWNFYCLCLVKRKMLAPPSFVVGDAADEPPPRRSGWHSPLPVKGDDDFSNHRAPPMHTLLDDDDDRSTPYQQTLQRFGKVFHDKVHDQIRLPGALVAVIDTPEFQRLRNLHQLGGTQFLFPGANNTRFEHSLGVAHLAMKFVDQLKQMHAAFGPPLDITDADVLCVGLAGLCHDLGHGPLSHMFEDFVNKHRSMRNEPHWHHETASIELFDYLIAKNELHMSVFGLAEHDLTFVKLLINGLAPGAPWPGEAIRRPPSKRFLFEIVANKRNGIDVDKLDYFLRDSLSCYGRLPDVLIERVFTCARAIEDEKGEFQICYEEKVALTLGDLFYLRAKLHKFVYQHRVTKVVDDMTLQALSAANDHFFIHTADGKRFKLHETVTNMEAYAKTGDWIVGAITASVTPELEAARKIFTNIAKRSLYKMVGFVEYRAKPPQEVAASIWNQLSFDEQQLLQSPDAICVLQSKIVYGSSGDKQAGQDPIRSVRFYNPKRSLNESTQLSEHRVSKLFSPRDYSEQMLLVFSRDPNNARTVIEGYERWKKTLKPGEAPETLPFANCCSPDRRPSVKRPRASREGVDGAYPSPRPSQERSALGNTSEDPLDAMSTRSDLALPSEM